MREVVEGDLIVGILGQWASGKTAAAKALIEYLGGEGEVTFITDRELFAGQAIDHFLELEDAEVTLNIEDDGRQRLDSMNATIWLRPGEDLKTVDLGTLRFAVHDTVMPVWHHRARVELGHQICKRAADGKPVVIEAAFGPDAGALGESPFMLSISDLFLRLKEGGVEARQVRWIIVEASHDIRSKRNQKRLARVPVDVFDRFAADGGDLDPEHRGRLEKRGTIIRRVANDHHDIERFKTDIIAAFEDMFKDA